jgi:hypothetical protein
MPSIPEYEDPWLVEAAAEGFKEGYGDGVEEIQNRLLLLEVGLAAIEVAITAGAGLIEVAVTRGMRMSLAVLRRMPIFIPGAVGRIGVVLQKGAPRVVAKVVEGSSRRLGKNLMAYLRLFRKAFGVRLPGEFAHHIVAHGDPRAGEALSTTPPLRVWRFGRLYFTAHAAPELAAQGGSNSGAPPQRRKIKHSRSSRDLVWRRSVGVLKQFGMHVDDWENGVFLPGYKTSPNPEARSCMGIFIRKHIMTL